MLCAVLFLLPLIRKAPRNDETTKKEEEEEDEGMKDALIEASLGHCIRRKVFTYDAATRKQERIVV